MRFEEVCRHLLQFEAVRGACSREWQIGHNLVMCTELDLAGYSALPVSPLATTPSRPPALLHIAFVRFRSGEATHVWADGAGALGDPMVPSEQASVDAYRMVIREWMGGDRDVLPPSTSTRVSDRFRR
jgi:hypothetical protein